MPKIWRNRIEAGTKKYADCPEKYKEDVIALMREEVTNGIITTERFEELTDKPYAR